MRASAMLSVAVAATSAALVVTLVQPAPRASAAGLDRIDAAGVTERGGSASYAHMLPRTGTNGVLDVSLLPPVADWASQPIARLYYASAGAAQDGNGSPQYPFRTLTYAFTNMAANSALLIAPGSYSGSCALPSGRTLTLFGIGGKANVTSLSVSVGGTSSATTLDLCGLQVGSLSVTGGRVNVRLAGTVVGRLEGSSTSVTVTRTDLGSSVAVSTLAHSDVYAGYATVPNATALVASDSPDRLTLSGGRASVSGNVVAYMSDVSASTADVNEAMLRLGATNSVLSGRISAEETARMSADTALAGQINAAKAELSARVDGVGTWWGGQLSTLSGSIDTLQGELRALRTKETNDVHSITQLIANVRAAYLAADTTMSALIAGLSDRLDGFDDSLDRTITVTATTVANGRIAAAKPDIVSNAVATADVHIGTTRTALENSFAASIAPVQTQASQNAGQIASIKSTLNSLILALRGASDGSTSLTNRYNIRLPAPVP